MVDCEDVWSIDDILLVSLPIEHLEICLEGCGSHIKLKLSFYGQPVTNLIAGFGSLFPARILAIE